MGNYPISKEYEPIMFNNEPMQPEKSAKQNKEPIKNISFCKSEYHFYHKKLSSHIEFK